MVANGIMLFLAGIIVLICALVLALKNRAFRNAQGVTGMITHKKSYVRGAKTPVTVYELTVAYTVGGVAYEGVVNADAGEWGELAVGQPLALVCRPDKPKKIARPGALNPKFARVTLIIGVALTAAGAILYAIGYWH